MCEGVRCRREVWEYGVGVRCKCKWSVIVLVECDVGVEDVRCGCSVYVGVGCRLW